MLFWPPTGQNHHIYIVKFSKLQKISNKIKNPHKINHVECEKVSISDFINFFYFLSFHCFFEATNLKFCSKMDSNWSIAISFWYLWTWKFCFWSRVYHNGHFGRNPSNKSKFANIRILHFLLLFWIAHTMRIQTMYDRFHWYFFPCL